jgi:hypothetical protein
LEVISENLHGVSFLFQKYNNNNIRAQDRDQLRALVNIEPSGSIKCWGVLEGLHNWQLLKKGLSRK